MEEKKYGEAGVAGTFFSSCPHKNNWQYKYLFSVSVHMNDFTS